MSAFRACKYLVLLPAFPVPFAVGAASDLSDSVFVGGAGPLLSVFDAVCDVILKEGFGSLPTPNGATLKPPKEATELPLATPPRGLGESVLKLKAGDLVFNEVKPVNPLKAPSVPVAESPWVGKIKNRIFSVKTV